MIRKTVFVLLLVVMLGTTSIFGQQAGRFSIGGRAGLGLGFHGSGQMEGIFRGELIDAGLPATINIEKKMLPNVNLAIFGAYTFHNRFAIQTELNFNINQGYKLEAYYQGQTIEAKAYYSSLDIPILLKVNIIDRPLVFGALAGPHFSFPLGDAAVDISVPGSPVEKWKEDIDNITIGLTAGIFAGYPLGPGRIIGDLRFAFDFNKLKVIERETRMKFDGMHRRGLVFSVGYEYSF